MPTNSPAACSDTADITFVAGLYTPFCFPLPGDDSGPSRFTRLALTKEAAQSECWRNTSLIFPKLYETLSPGYILKGFPASNPTIMTVMGILNTVYLPRGMTTATHTASNRSMPCYGRRQSVCEPSPWTCIQQILYDLEAMVTW